MSFNNKVAFWVSACVLQALILNLCGCAQSAPKPFDTVFEISAGGKTLSAQVAVFDVEKARGLMFRKSLPENGAMVFVNETPQRASYWMKNTKIPLDIAFVAADGTITQIAKLYPRELTPVDSERDDIAFCVETNAGWFAANGVCAGGKIDVEAIRKAVKQRRGE